MEVKSVLLVGPQSKQGTYDNPLTGVLYLHSTLRASNIPVDWVDENIGDVIDVSQHDIIGISMMTSNRHRSLEIAKQAKEAGKYVVIGGPHPTLMARHLLENYPYIDVCVRGDGEQPLLDIARNKRLEHIAGVSWMVNGEVVETTRIRPSLDALSFPSWDTVPWEKYVGGARIFFSRGCVYGKCVFCSVAAQWGDQRWRSPEKMIQEMLWLKELGQGGFAMYDDCMTGNPELVTQLFNQMIEAGLNDMWWCCTTRVSMVDREMIGLIKRAGCDEITFGVETAHPEAMKLYAKGQTVEQATQAVSWCKEVGLKCSVLMIYQGFRAAEFDPVSHQWVAKMGVGEGSAHELQIFPATPLYKAMVAHGKMSDDFWLGPQPFGLYRGELDHLGPADWAAFH